MASSSNTKRNHEVFLSFRGMDVHNNFLSHLYAALDQRGMHTFMNSEELRKGEEISPTLVQAIEESRIAIVIFSKDYASSPWCLKELLKIVECAEQGRLFLFPVFYKVEPREVRQGRESYRRAMAEHEFKFGKDSKELQRWKKALFDVSGLFGWYIEDGDAEKLNNQNFKHEARLTQSMAKQLWIILNQKNLHVATYPVGIYSKTAELIRLSKIESANNDVLMIGIWGPGGIGKTTILKALYNKIWHCFDGCSFLARVRETSNQRDGLVALQEKLLYEILNDKDLKVYSVARGISLIRKRLCCKKVLLLLDDVDQLDQLYALAGEGNWFGKGSRIIITSRNKHLLASHGVNFVYEAKPLRDGQALELFYRHAFLHKEEIGGHLIKRVVGYARGLPLALEVLGSFLRGRKEPEWESTLRKLSKCPHQTINLVLKTSFDGLEDNEREIFLDIACFFKGKRIEYIKEVLDSCDFDTILGLQILIERSLIRYENGFLQMHDLVQLMGKDIVNQECLDDPRKRSRLWLLKDVQDILCGNTGTNAIKAIVLDSLAPKEITISPNAFTDMKRLRILILHKVHIPSKGPIHLPHEIRCFDLTRAPRSQL